MKRQWVTQTVGDLRAKTKHSLIGGPFGSNLVSRDYTDQGVPVIRGRNLPDNAPFSFNDLVFVSEKKADALRPNNAFPGDLIFTQRGTLGQVGIVPKKSPYSRFVISQSQMKLAVDPDKADAQYLYYYFRLPSTRERIHGLAISSGVPHINLDILRKFQVITPPVPIQKRIAAILSAYDDLIENTVRRSVLVEKLAEDIYREWFVRLRFPGRQTVKLENRRLRDFIVEYIGGDWGEDLQSPKFGNPVYVIRGTDFDNVQQGDISSVPLRYITDSGLRSRKLKAGDLIVENSVNHQSRTTGKSLLVTQHVLDLFDGDVICASFCKLIRPKEIRHSKFLALNFRLLFTQGFFDYFQNIATNGIANLQTERFMDRHLIPFHDAIDLNVFDSLDTSLLAKSLAKLKETRDKLLPRLISGKLSLENLDIQLLPSIAEEVSAEPAATAHA
jgi:type I restriction enzyme S subunit